MERAIRLGREKVDVSPLRVVRLLSRSLRAGRTGRACAELLKISINTDKFTGFFSKLLKR